ncbi:MAG: hypothetical protein IKF97_02515 [Clostridia bacterium]|nr:hypothetical protein [Clostridia bacterium]
MSSCLGLYVQDNLIKYAKVSKERDTKKIDAFGVKFYDDNVNLAIKQVIEETYSFNTPISINIEGETYQYFDMFSLLSKKDLTKAIKTEFDAYCNEKGYNPNVFETRYAVVPNVDDKQKLKVIYVTDNKIELNKRMQLVSDYKLSTLAPISTSIVNLQEFEERQNAIIVNIEDSTTITTILDQKIYDVQKIPEGTKEILDRINIKENSFTKSYEVCKNTTIYTSEGRDLQETETSYLEDIMPTLYTIVGQVKKIINEQDKKFEKVYITGTAALINNIDLYFQEYLDETRCEILKPNFIFSTKDISIKDYIEVNSAISLALLGVGEGLTSMNFKAQSFYDKLPDWMKNDVKLKNKKDEEDGEKTNTKTKGKINFNLGEKLDFIEKNLIRGAYSLLILFIIFSAFSMMLNHQQNIKKEEAENRVKDIESQITLAKADDTKIKNRTSEYTNLIKNLEEINTRLNERLRLRNAIPNLLNQIMYIIPENVQITSIQNTQDRHIEIIAQSDKYEPLGYLKAKIKAEPILNNVVSTAGEKENDIVTVKIEGDLP